MAARKFCHWRPVHMDAKVRPQHIDHLPNGENRCRVCWKPCWNKVDNGGHCEECTVALRTHPNSLVRITFLQDPTVDMDTIELMLSDFNAGVAQEAEKQYLLRTAHNGKVA